MLKGHLHFLPKSKKWVVRYMRTPQIITELPVHPKDAELLIKSDHLTRVYFQIETIAIGESEFDIRDCDVAVINGKSDLYSTIETAIINWTVENNKTAGELTREIMDIINRYKK